MTASPRPLGRLLLAGGAGLALVATGLAWVVGGPSAGADPGEIDVQLTIDGDFDAGASPTPTGELRLTLTNDDHNGALSTEAVDVVVDTGVVTDDLDTANTPPHTDPPDSTYDPGSGEWEIAALPAGESIELTIPFVFNTTAGHATANAEVVDTADDQPDGDSEPDDGGIIGDQDDEGVFRISDVAGAAAFTGNVWNDIDANGVRTGVEPGVADTFVVISQAGTTLFAGPTTAAADGDYGYAYLPEGDTDVRFIAPPGYAFTVQGDEPNESDPDALGVVATFTVDETNRDTIDAGLTADADLSVQKTANAPTVPDPPGLVTYTVQVSNAGPGATDDVVVEDILPVGAELDDDTEALSQGSFTYDGAELGTWDVGLLLPGQSATAVYVVGYPGIGTFENHAHVTASTAFDPTSEPDPTGTTCDLQTTDDDCDTASVEVIPEGEPSADSATTPQGQPTTFNVLDNDGIYGRAPGAELPSGWTFARLDGGTTQGSVTCDDEGDCTYTPVDGYVGPDEFTYRLTSPTAAETDVEVGLSVVYANDPPLARDDSARTDVDTDVDVDVLANDEDPNHPADVGDPNKPGDTVDVTTDGVVTPPGAGDVSCTLAGGPCTFDPAPGYEGEAGFTYTITDDGGLFDTATVALVVEPDALPEQGFTGATGDTATATTDGWEESTTVTPTSSCTAGRPRIALSWTAVDDADRYQVERRVVSPLSGDPDIWITIATPTTVGWDDDLVGEGVEYEYRVTPLVERWVGDSSGVVTETTPSASTTSAAGC